MSEGVLRYHFIHVGRDADLETHADKPIYYIFNNKGGYAMGQIFYYPPWNQWVTRFDPESVWSEGCLDDVRNAVGRITQCQGHLPASPQG